MWPFRVRQDYQAVARDEDGLDLDERKEGESTHAVATPTGIWPYLAGGLILLLAALAIAIFVFAPQTSAIAEQPEVPGGDDSGVPSIAQSQDAVGSQENARCAQRREWRTLSTSEQQAYISAVKCLQTIPSVLSEDDRATSYDDFPWLHSHVGYRTHNSAPFLPWHRYFLHIYHQTLRDKCSYTGELVYWDWTLDSDALEDSPIFDPKTGFGGDGDPAGNITVGRTGRCLIDGPFAETQVSFYDVKFQPHCLSRGFRDNEGRLGHMDGHDISSASIEEVLGMDSYEDFVAAMESRVHDAIPFGIAGDFETFTAPYDPIFFLHHTQLDRLWYLWQQRQPDQGLQAYSGHNGRHFLETASLDDELHYRKLAPSVKVRDVMDVQNGLLCYRY